MKWLAIAVASACLALGSTAFAQATATPTDTPLPTDTPTITNTPTRTPTPTQTLKPQDAISLQEPCPTASTCDIRYGKSARAGHKTVAISTTTGTANVALMCRPDTGNLAPEITLSTHSGTTCTTAANCLKEFDTWCEEVFLRISACNACAVSGWIKRDGP